MGYIAAGKLHYGLAFEWDISTDTIPGLPWDPEEDDGTDWWKGLPEGKTEKPFTCESFGQGDHRAYILTSQKFPGFFVEWGALEIDPAQLTAPSAPEFEVFAQKYFPDKKLAWYLTALLH